MKHLSLLSITFLTLLLCSCKDSTSIIGIHDVSFKEYVSEKENLIITFDQDVIPDSLSQRWEKKNYLQIKPNIEGEYRWRSSKVLTFVPRVAYKPGTTYTVAMGAALLEHKDSNFDIKTSQTYTFKTEELKLIDHYPSWKQSSRNSNESAVAVTLKFNYNINASDLFGKIKTRLGKDIVEHFILPGRTNKEITVEVYPPVSSRELNEIEITLDEGLRIHGFENAHSLKRIVAKVEVPDIEDLQVVELAASHDGVRGYVNINTSQQISEQDFKSLISIRPAVDFEVSTNLNGLTLSSDNFNIDKDYEVIVSENLKGLFRTNLKAEYSEIITFGKLDPKIDFTNNKAEYLTSKGEKNVAVTVVNVPKLKLIVYKIFQNNILAFRRAGSRNRWHTERLEGGDYTQFRYIDYSPEQYGSKILEQEIETKNLESLGRMRVLNLDFLDNLSEFNGHYLITLQHEDKNYISDSKYISISDIGMIVKEDKDQVYVFTNSIKGATPLAGIPIKGVGQNNQEIYSTVTDGDGVAIIKKSRNKLKDTNLSLVTAKNGSDFNYLNLRSSHENFSRFDIGGFRTENSEYQAFIYGERELYRPGETIHVAGIVRDLNWKSPGELPFQIKFISPSGKTYKTIKKTLNSQGAFEFSIPLSAKIATGSYSVDLFTANDVLVTSKRIKVEEFMPDRIKVKSELDKEELKSGEEIKLSVLAENFFGPPAADRNYEVEMTLNKTNFHAPKYSRFDFSLQSETEIGKVSRNGVTSAEGTIDETFEISEFFKDIGLLTGKIYTTVFDENGRPVSQSKNFKVYTQDKFFGLSIPDRYVKTQRPMEISMIAVDKNGEATNESALLRIYRYEYRTVLENNGRGRYRYRSNREEVLEFEKDITLSGEKNTYTFTPTRSGSYHIKLSKDRKSSFVVKNLYAYGWGDTRSTSFEVNNEGTIDIEFDKDEYTVGQQARVLLKTPFKGRVLVSIERDEIIKHFYTNTDQKSAQLNIDITPDMVPNAYITATLIRPHKGGSNPLTVAYGVENIKVDDTQNKLPLDIEAVSKSRSKTKQSVIIKTAPYAEVAIAAVDEGILQITNYESPNPYDFFYQKRAHEVDGYDLYPYLFPELEVNGLLQGGGAGPDGQRSFAFGQKRIKLLSQWSGLKKADASGLVEMELDIPQFSGDMRIMAVAYDENRFAGNATNMKIADPVVISTGLPRFLSPEDEVNIPVTVTNTTAQAKKGFVKILTEGPVEIEGETEREVDIPANSEKRVTFTGSVMRDIGDAKIDVTVNDGSEVFSEEIEIAVRPASSLLKNSGSGSVRAGEDKSFELENDYTENSRSGQLIVSSSPMVELGDHLDYLIRYPYGCLEQTLSKAFPQVYLEDLSKYISSSSKKKNNNPRYNVQQAIYKIQNMQRSSGAFSYWYGGSYENWWASTYATHFLHEAKNAGYDVDNSVLKRAISFISRRVKNKETTNYYYSGNRTYTHANRSIPYSLYVLALAGKPDVPMMNYYKANPELLSPDAKYLLAASYGISGDKDRFEKLLPDSFGDLKAENEFSETFSSYTRDLGMALNVLIEADPNHPQIPKMVRTLSQEMKNRRSMNTQERVWALLALGKFSENNAEATCAAAIYADGKKISDFNGEDVILTYDELGSDKLRLDASGEGELYYFWQIQGLSATGEVEEKDNYLSIRRTFLDKSGRTISNNKFKQNDLIIVRLDLKSKYSRQVENVAITDILPAGFEIENPRINDMPDLDFIKDAATPDHIDMRDDRIHLFATARSKTRSYFYVVRAVSKGEFKVGPASADAMYNNDFYSYNGAGIVTIE